MPIVDGRRVRGEQDRIDQPLADIRDPGGHEAGDQAPDREPDRQRAVRRPHQLDRARLLYFEDAEIGCAGRACRACRAARDHALCWIDGGRARRRCRHLQTHPRWRRLRPLAPTAGAKAFGRERPACAGFSGRPSWYVAVAQGAMREPYFARLRSRRRSSRRPRRSRIIREPEAIVATTAALHRLRRHAVVETICAGSSPLRAIFIHCWSGSGIEPRRDARRAAPSGSRCRRRRPCPSTQGAERAAEGSRVRLVEQTGGVAAAGVAADR